MKANEIGQLVNTGPAKSSDIQGTGSVTAGMDRRALSIRAGLVAPLLAVCGVLLATFLDPAFSWWHGSLTHAGELPAGESLSLGLFVDHPSILLFNGSLILAGAIGLPFSWLLHGDARRPLQRSGSVALSTAYLGVLTLGTFHQPSPYHVPAAIVTVLATVSFLWIYGAGTVQSGRTRFGAVTVLLGLLLVAAWIAWDAVVPSAGMAVPEFAVLATLSGWTFAAASIEFEAEEGRRPVVALRRAVGGVGSNSVD